MEELIHQQCEISVQTIPAGNVPGECQEKTIAVYNCSSDSDLHKTVTALKDAGSLGLIAGCAGLAEILPEVLEWQKKEIKEPVLPEKFLVVCGSVNPITVKQLDYAEKNGVITERISAPRASARLLISTVSFVVMQPVPAYTGTRPLIWSTAAFRTSSFS